MKISNILRKIPIVGEKITRLKPRIEDILKYHFGERDELIIIDVGANIGQSISFFRSIFPNSIIYSFEPTPNTFQQLKQKYKSYKNIYLFNFGLGDENGIKDFYVSEYSPTNSFLHPKIELYKKFNNNLSNKLEQSKIINIQVLKFDDWQKEKLNNRGIDIFKIDTQGYEYNVIKGAINSLKNRTKLLLFEIQYLTFYENQIPFYKIYELLYENDFYLFSLIPSSIKDNYQLLECDVIFFNKRFFNCS